MNRPFLYLFLTSIMVFSISSIQAQESPDIMIDGPYIRYTKDKITSYSIHLKEQTKYVKIDELKKSKNAPIIIQVPTDVEGHYFPVQLKSKLSNENAITNKASKLFVVSDIEANFKAFRILLQANKVIDEHLNWTFGDGHLVLTGDFFDRGSQLNEVLWLIYSLEEKAKAAKGYVHFILGNHEIMNLNGDLRYVPAKYHENAKLMQCTYLSLYDESTELGRWLRTKNIMEVVGDGLFVHGGISNYVNQMAMPIQEINKIARPYYADTSYNYPTAEINLLYSDFGPLWYRGYYLGKDKAAVSQIDSTLELYNVKFIATGHTIVTEQVNTYFNGKVINTDVSHAKGISQALLIQDNKYYRVNNKGEKTELK